MTKQIPLLPKSDTKNRTLFFGDNLDILRDKIPEESFDLIYLDPPFNSKRPFNVLFKEGLVDSPAQVQAFEDSWHWTHEAKATFDELVMQGGDLSELMQALEKIVGANDILAYLAMMAIRLQELHRVLKPNGSIYLHCDPTASHYLKIVMDVIFGKLNFQNEITWKRTSAHSDTKQGLTRYGRIHDVLLFYTKSGKNKWVPQYTPYDREYMDAFYVYVEYDGTIYRILDFHKGELKELESKTRIIDADYNKKGRRLRLGDLTAAKPGGDTEYEWKGVKPYKGRYWAYSKAKMQKFDKDGRIYYSPRTGFPQYKRYLSEMPGVPLQDIWADIRPIGSRSPERMSYPTQKPESLMRRIILSSSKKGDWVLDPFAGCGTTVIVAEELERNWVGIDITTLAINLVKRRLGAKFQSRELQITVDGVPKDVDGAKMLFQKDPFEYEYWALDVIGATPAKDKKKGKMKGADKGIDGIIMFRDLDDAKKILYRKAVVQVKGGGVKRADIATLKGDMSREKADIGIFITLEEPSKQMKEEAVDAGFFTPDFNKAKFPKVQILTIEDLFSGKRPQMPQSLPYHKAAPAFSSQKDLFNTEVSAPIDFPEAEEDTEEIAD